MPGLAAGERDALQALFTAGSRETVLFFTNRGRALGVPVHQLPDVAQQTRGLPVGNLVHLEGDEQVIAVLHQPDTNGEGFLSLGTAPGQGQACGMARDR